MRRRSGTQEVLKTKKTHFNKDIEFLFWSGVTKQP